MSTKQKRIFLLCCLPAAAVVFAFAYFMFFKLTGIGFFCILNRLTGLRCPGCGNSHAVWALLHFDFAGAFAANGIAFAEIIYFLYLFAFAGKKYVETGRVTFCGTNRVINIAFLALLIVWFVARNILKI